jgi:RHS repeat-associated protein
VTLLIGLLAYQIQASIYRYDRLNRLKISVDRNFNGSSWQGASNKYRTSYTYDANGNLLTLNRFDQSGQRLDSLLYSYNTQAGKAANNRLERVTDRVGSTAYKEDIEGISNYSYDAIGNLVYDSRDSVSINWNVFGKVSSVIASFRTNGSSKPSVFYSYDASGNRVSKRVVWQRQLGGKGGSQVVDSVKTTYYVRDASGNVMSVYESSQKASNQPLLRLKEQPLYGSDRLGQRKDTLLINENGQPGSLTASYRLVGGKEYELKDHLGNVRVVVSDSKQATYLSSSLGLLLKAQLRSYSDYYPFGMIEPGSSWQTGVSYRYGFNGKEKDGEFANNYDYGFRIYNANIAKFLSVDPLTAEYPFLTPYQFASNTPIWAIDQDGLEAHPSQYLWQSWNETSGHPIPKDINTQKGSERYGIEIATEFAKAYGTVYLAALPIEEAIIGGIGWAGSKLWALTRFGKAVNKSSTVIKVEKARKIAEVTKNSPEVGKTWSGINSKILDNRFKDLSPLAKELTKGNELGIQIARSEDDIRYLDYMNAEAAYFKADKPFMLIREGADRPTILEELIHHNQQLKYGEKYFYANRDKLEVEAQNILLEVGTKEGWSKKQLDRIQSAKDTWLKKVKGE